MQYWINHNGVQSGPVDLEALKQMNLTAAAYVWHEGLSDWVKITQVPELQGLYQTPVQGAAAVTGTPYQPQQPAPAVEQGPQQTTPGEPCPPTNLVWAIIATVLCCIPTGIVAIIYALKVAGRYRAGDLEGAKRASETGAWWCIASIVLGVLYVPLAVLLKFMPA